MIRLFYTVLFVALSVVVSAKSYTETYTIEFSESDFNLVINSDNRANISPKDITFSYLGVNKPALPITPYRIAIPSNRRYVSSSYVVKKNVKATDIIVANSPRVAINSDSNIDNNEAIYNDNRVHYTPGTYPDENASYVHSYGWKDEVFLNFLVCPFIYEMKENCGTLHFVNSIELTVITEDVEDESVHSDIISEESEFKSFAFESNDINVFGGGIPLHPTEPTKIDYLIVTSEALKDAFKPLYNWKREKGLRSKIITIEEINSKYNEGSQELNLKMCLYDMWKENSLKYVLLGGDVNLVPAKKCYGCFLDKYGVLNSTADIPTDLFYACFNGAFDWNANGDMEVGELEDNVNYTQHIILTRASVQTPEHVEAFVNKVISYEQNPKYSHSILTGGCKLYEDYYVNPYFDPISDAQHLGDLLFDNYIKPYWGGSRDCFYDTYTSFPGGASYQLNGNNLIDVISRGYSFIHMNTHGSIEGWQMENGTLYHKISADAQTNSGYSIITSGACETNYFDKDGFDCLSEKLIRGKDSGILAYLACSREGLTYRSANALGPSETFNANFYKTLFDKDLDEHSFGGIVCLTKNKFVTFCQRDEMRWILYGVNPMGDPEMPIYISTPKEFTDVKINYNRQLGVTCDTGLPGCRICFTYTRSLNQFQTVFNSAQQGYVSVSEAGTKVNVCITKDGYRPFRQTIVIPMSDEEYNCGSSIVLIGKILDCTPNPTNGISTISYQLGGEIYSSQLLVAGLNGNVERTIALDPTRNELSCDFSSLKKGIYVVTLVVNGQAIDFTRFIKE